MQFLFISAAILMSSTASQACSQYEAQFFGKVTTYDSATCQYTLQFSSFQGHILCPLDNLEASSTKLLDKSCKLEIGDQISGVLVKNAKEFYID